MVSGYRSFDLAGVHPALSLLEKTGTVRQADHQNGREREKKHLVTTIFHGTSFRCFSRFLLGLLRAERSNLKRQSVGLPLPGRLFIGARGLKAIINTGKRGRLSPS